MQRLSLKSINYVILTILLKKTDHLNISEGN